MLIKIETMSEHIKTIQANETDLGPEIEQLLPTRLKGNTL